VEGEPLLLPCIGVFPHAPLLLTRDLIGRRVVHAPLGGGRFLLRQGMGTSLAPSMLVDSRGWVRAVTLGTLRRRWAAPLSRLWDLTLREATFEPGRRVRAGELHRLVREHGRSWNGHFAQGLRLRALLSALPADDWVDEAVMRHLQPAFGPALAEAEWSARYPD
jgi:hypothetical protein